MDTNPTKRLEELRTELRAERISYGELLELQSLAKYIDPGDTELLEAAGVPEHVMSMKSGDQYVAASGRCPRCDSDNIQAVENFNPESQGMEIDCGECGLQYFDAYTLTGYYIVNGAGVDEYNATPLGRPITDAQRDTILAALRLWQAHQRNEISIALRGGDPGCLEWLDSIAQNGGDHPALTPNQIDELCEQLNITGARATVDTPDHDDHMICSVCGNCSESLDDNDLCNDCAREGA